MAGLIDSTLEMAGTVKDAASDAYNSAMNSIFGEKPDPAGRTLGKGVEKILGFRVRKDAEDIIERHDDRNHHGRDCKFLIPKDIAHERNPHEYEIAAENRLDHRAAPPIRLLYAADDNHGQQEHEQQRTGSEQHEPRPKGRRDIRRIDVVEHHDRKKHAKDHAVHMHEFFIRQQPVFLDQHTDKHQTEQWNDRLCRYN